MDRDLYNEILIGHKFTFINEEQHSELMKYWDEEHELQEFCTDIKVPYDDIYSYIYMEDNGYDCIHVMRTEKGVHLFGCAVANLENAFRWFINDYEDESEIAI